ncbi:LamG-like jellyroll fold domain-containing protein [Neolewinella persica]|uniref:LamG-like jellyroll fold domain-containing protein n=1 Tax=Neolewinella persica TaxID=70998 RepID=UPI0012FC89E5|nr:LamG-like jellyroll fold domain-containing protein [Neolewinella persica]
MNLLHTLTRALSARLPLFRLCSLTFLCTGARALKRGRRRERKKRRLILAAIPLLLTAFSPLLGQDMRPAWHFMDKASMPLPSENMPDYVKPLYTTEVDYNEIMEIHQEYYADRGMREWREDLERDPYAKFFHHWMQGAAAEVNADGKVRQLSTTELLDRRAAIIAAERRTPALLLEKSAATWSFVGPRRTVWRAEHRPNQQVAPWQVNVYAFAASQSNPDILFATSETGEVYKTTDKGLNWIPIMTYNWGGAGRAIAIHPTNPSVVFVSTNTDIVRSTDGGMTWASVLTASGLSGNSLEFSPNGGTIIAGTGQGVRRSTDGGSTWSTQLSGEILDVAFRPGDNNTVYALLRQSSPSQCMLYKSMNGGVSFSLSMTGWTPYPDHSGGRITVTPADPDYLYVGLLQDPVNQVPVILKSTNAAGSWTQTAIGGTANFDGNNGQGYYDLDIEANDLNAEEVIFATTTAWKSSDGGVSYTAIGGYSGDFDIHPDIQEIISIGGDTWLATDGGMNYSTDFFSDVANWEARIDGLDGTNFWGYDQGWNEDYMIGGRYHNGNTAMHENYPAQYALRMGGAESPTGHAWHGKPRHAMFDDISNTILPANFTSVAEGSFSFSKFPNIWYYGSGYSSLLIDHEDYETFYVGEGNDFWRSEDGGNSWESLHNFGSEVFHFDISRANSDYVYLLARNGIYKSTDRGESFTSIALPPGLSANNASYGRIAASGTNPLEVWLMDYRAGASSSRNRVWYSSNGGSSWTSWHTSTLAGRQWTALAHHVGSNGGIYIASDRGGIAGTMPAKVMYRDKSMTEWMDCSAGFPASANPQKMLPFYRDNVLRWAGNRGVWEMPLVEQNWSPIAQPFVNGSDVLCPNDPVSFGSYSVAKASATYSWSLPGSTTTTALNQREVNATYATPGTYTATLTVSQSGQTDTKAVEIVVGDNCVPDKFPGNSVVLAGNAGDYVTMKDPLNITTNTLTMSAWIKRDGPQVSTAGIFFMRSSSAVALNFYDSENLSIHWNDTQWWWDSGLTVPDGEWAHVAMTVAPDQVILYLNGVPSVRNFTVDAVNFDGPISLGRDPGRSSRQFKGEMDEVVIYDRTLSQDEIRELMHLTRKPAEETGVLAYYQFNREEGLVSNRATGIHAALSGSASRTTSTAPVGPGESARLDVNASGNYAFGGTGLELDFPTGTVPNGELCVSRIDVRPDQVPAIGEVTDKYWVVHNYGSNGTFSELNAMTFNSIGTVNGAQAADPSSIQLYKRASTAHGTTWGEVSATATSATAGADGSATFGTGNGQTSFSQFILGFQSPALGAELIQFAASIRDQKVVDLTWVSANEENLAFYELQRSAEGGSYIPLAELPAVGNSTVNQSYAYVDEAPLRGRAFYRLRLVDVDGMETFSEVRSVLFQGLADRVSVFPNPLRAGELLNVRTKDRGAYALDLYTADGEQVGTYPVTGDAAIRLPELPTGVYSYLVRSAAYRSGGVLVIE